LQSATLQIIYCTSPGGATKLHTWGKVCYRQWHVGNVDYTQKVEICVYDANKICKAGS